MTITLTREEAQQVLDALENKFLFMASDCAIFARAEAMKTLRVKLSEPEPILPGGGIGRHPDPEPTIDGWPLYSGLPPAKVQDKTFEEFAQSFAQSARVNGIPEREWHELTDNEIAAIKSKYGFGVNIFSFTSAVRELETWLKERNNG